MVPEATATHKGAHEEATGARLECTKQPACVSSRPMALDRTLGLRAEEVGTLATELPQLTVRGDGARVAGTHTEEADAEAVLRRLMSAAGAPAGPPRTVALPGKGGRAAPP